MMDAVMQGRVHDCFEPAEKVATCNLLAKIPVRGEHEVPLRRGAGKLLHIARQAKPMAPGDASR